ncbi:MAG TPA: hypothetical protein VG758_14775 [Hyphomicrobiaceae bacterium]|nr:hypothetical protein [Hyphomicrobiaceae bacterium]
MTRLRGASAGRTASTTRILAPIVAYVGEVMREAATGRWEIRGWDFSGGEPTEKWEPVIVAADGRVFHPFHVFKALLERGSVWTRVEVDLGFSRAGPRTELQRPARGPLGEVPADAYRVTRRHPDGRPSIVTFDHDTCVGGFPCRAGAEVYFDKSGEPFGGTRSRTHSFGTLLFGSGTQVGYGKGQKGVREASRERSLDPLRKFRISHAGKPRSLNPSASRSR